MNYVSNIATFQKKLHLVQSAVEPIDSPPPLPEQAFSLSLQPQRPGEISDWLEIQLSAEAAEHVRSQAAVPAGLWLAIAIEAERSLEELEISRDSEATIESLDVAAEERLEPAIRRQQTRSLHAYAQALRRGNDFPTDPVGSRVSLTPSTSTVARWEHHAKEKSLLLNQWISEAAERLPKGRLSWEAAAAERGLALSEWILRNSAKVQRP